MFTAALRHLKEASNWAKFMNDVTQVWNFFDHLPWAKLS
jgi:ABC-type uncharacterized transport system YnjBCD substrate-binding protein